MIATQSPSFARMTSGWIASLRSPTDTCCDDCSASTAGILLVRTYIFPSGSWSPKRLTGMLTSIAVTSNVFVTPMPARHAAVRDVGAADALGAPAVSCVIGTATAMRAVLANSAGRRIAANRMRGTAYSRNAVGTRTTSRTSVSLTRPTTGSTRPDDDPSDIARRSWFPAARVTAATPAATSAVSSSGRRDLRPCGLSRSSAAGTATTTSGSASAATEAARATTGPAVSALMVSVASHSAPTEASTSATSASQVRSGERRAASER